MLAAIPRRPHGSVAPELCSFASRKSVLQAGAPGTVLHLDISNNMRRCAQARLTVLPGSATAASQGNARRTSEGKELPQVANKQSKRTNARGSQVRKRQDGPHEVRDVREWLLGHGIGWERPSSFVGCLLLTADLQTQEGYGVTRGRRGSHRRRSSRRSTSIEESCWREMLRQSLSGPGGQLGWAATEGDTRRVGEWTVLAVEPAARRSARESSYPSRGGTLAGDVLDAPSDSMHRTCIAQGPTVRGVRWREAIAG